MRTVENKALMRIYRKDLTQPEKRELNEAVGHFQKAIELKPELADSYYNMGNAYKDKKQFDDAIACYQKALQRNHQIIEAHNNLGVAYQEKGQLDEAIVSYHNAIQMKGDYAEAYFNLGNAFHKNKQYDQAIKSYHSALMINPTFSEAYNNLGLVLKEQGSLKEAICNFRKALQITPNFAMAFYNLGTILYMQKELAEAITYFEKALQFDPDIAPAYYNLGCILQEKGKVSEATFYYQKAIEHNLNFADPYYGLGTVYYAQGYLNKAICSFEKAVQINPAFTNAYMSIGTVFREKGQFDKAISYYQKAIEIDPLSAESYNNLGAVFQEKQKIDLAIEYYRKALQIDSNFHNAYINLGMALHTSGNQEEALTVLDEAIRLNPGSLKAQWAKCMVQIPLLYADEANIQISRQCYYNELITIKNIISHSIAKDVEGVSEAVGSRQPFYLTCQGLNDRELQKIYGDMVCNIMASRYPHFDRRPFMPPYSSDKPFRIGIISRFFYWHSVWKIPMRGWLENMNKERFHLYGYYTGRKKDHVTETARKQCYRFVEDIYSFEELCRIVQDDNLHALIYPEIGMDPMTLRLASLRLAPVQCASLGHPDTTGLPTMDYYLSSELMEPIDGDEHYTERLIRLPNLGFSYIPFDVPFIEPNHETFGLRSGSVVYLCSHALFTHLPQYDFIYPHIARENPDCQFVFISDFRYLVTEQFHERLRRTFSQYNLNADDYIVILPRLSQEKYHALNCVADVFLDTIGWSANNSTFEAIACNLPIVTLPGNLMRQRHCAGILNMMGMKETIASSINEYIELAVRLAKDSDWRQQIATEIAEKKNCIYRDRACITALEDFFEKAVKEKLGL
jgi:predicted O-linked N-acetylglucosamine transferase (SPINDLY family)